MTFDIRTDGKRFRTLFLRLTEYEQEEFIEKITNDVLHERLLLIDRDACFDVTMMSLDYFLEDNKKSGDFVKQQRLRRYLTTSTLKKRNEEQIISFPSLRICFNIFLEELSDEFMEENVELFI